MRKYNTCYMHSCLLNLLVLSINILYLYNVFLLSFVFVQTEFTQTDASKLTTDDKSLPTLKEIGLGELCPKINDLTLEFLRSIDLDVIPMVASLFPRVAELGIVGPRDYWVTLDKALAFCTKLATSYPRLTSLSLTDVGLGNKTTEKIVGNLRHQDCLKSLR